MGDLPGCISFCNISPQIHVIHNIKTSPAVSGNSKSSSVVDITSFPKFFKFCLKPRISHWHQSLLFLWSNRLTLLISATLLPKNWGVCLLLFPGRKDMPGEKPQASHSSAASTSSRWTLYLIYPGIFCVQVTLGSKVNRKVTSPLLRTFLREIYFYWEALDNEDYHNKWQLGTAARSHAWILAVILTVHFTSEFGTNINALKKANISVLPWK